MPSYILVAPVGSGKTQAVLERLIKLKECKPLARTWILLPGKRQEEMFRQRLIEHHSNRAVYFNIHFFSFYTLYKHLLDIAGTPHREPDDAARAWLLQSIAIRLRDEGRLSVYGSIAHTPGFLKILGDFIYELKRNIIDPTVYEQLAERGTERDRDLAQLYSAYQNTLRHYALVDREGEGWLALEAVRSRPEMATDVDFLVADGFDQFNPLHTQLLALLSSRASDALITLPTVPYREHTVGRRFQQALENLTDAYRQTGQPIHIQSIPVTTHHRHPALQHLLDAALTSPRTTGFSSDGCLKLIEAPDPAQEVAAVLRRVKRVLLETHCRPDDILIAVRDWGRYGRHFITQARIYGIPLALHYGEPLAENPAIIALLNLLELPGSGFPRRAMMDTLRSPYFEIKGLGSEHIDQLERVSRALKVIGGESSWLEAIAIASRTPLDPESDSQETVLTSLESQYLQAHVGSLFQALRPPAEGTISDYVEWLESLIGPDSTDNLDDEPQVHTEAGYSLRVLKQLRLGDPELVNRDLTALHQFKCILRSLLSAQSLMQALGQNMAVTWTGFYSDLKRAISRAMLNRESNRFGKVLVTSVTDARGLPHRHVFIPGLSEGIFPASPGEDSLYLDSERLALIQAGMALETRSESAADEGLFYEMLGLARESLTLSRPTTDNGNHWPESHLWRAVKNVFSDADVLIERDRKRQGSTLPAQEAAALEEAALAVADGLNRPSLIENTTGLYNWLLAAHQSYWRNIRLARLIEKRRLSKQPHDHYSGHLSQPMLLAWVAEELGPGRVWSASQFNDYGMCGFRFFAKRLLKLEALEEPEEGMDAAQLGTLNHEILEKTYHQIKNLGIAITPEHHETALQILREMAEAVLRQAPAKLGFRPSTLWEQEKQALIRKLEALVWLDFSDDSPVNKKFGNAPRYPYVLEAPFGVDGDVIEIALDDEAPPLKVRGYIDRIDLQDGALVLIDYKTGSTGIPIREIERGRNFQMTLYLLVANELISQQRDAGLKTVAGGLFWHIRNRQISGSILLDEDGWALLQRSKAQLNQHIKRGRNGDFTTHSGKAGPCAHYCEFSRLCRVNNTNQSKQR